MAMKQEQGHSHAPEEEELVSGKVDLHADVIGEIEVPKGTTLSELLQILAEKGHDANLAHYVTLMLDGRSIRIKADGTLEEDPVLTQDFVLSLTKQLTGGKPIPFCGRCGRPCHDHEPWCPYRDR